MTPEDFVPKYYYMDPETEDVLFDGSFLKNGMVVLIEDPKMRLDPTVEGILSDVTKRDYLLRYNRWGEILNMRINLPEDSVELLLQYPDGTKRKAIQDIRQAWIIKKDSVPGERTVGIARVRPPWMSEFKQEFAEEDLEAIKKEFVPTNTNVLPLDRRTPQKSLLDLQLPPPVDEKERYFPPLDSERQ